MNACATFAAAPLESREELSWEDGELSPAVDDLPPEDESALAIELTPDAAEIDARLVSWQTCFEIKNPFQEYQLRQLVTETLRMERCQNEEWALIRQRQTRALGSWDVDREGEVLVIAGKLSRNPERWKCELKRSAHGTRWIINQWKQLRQALQTNKSWDERQRTRALDLLGVPTLFRKHATAIDLPLDELDARIAQEIEDHELRLERGLNDIDEVSRGHAEQGYGLFDDKRIWAIRRFEAGCNRRYQQLLKDLPRKNTPSARPTSSSVVKRPSLSPTRPRMSQDERFLAGLTEAIQTVSKPHTMEQLSRLLSPESPPIASASPATEFAPSTRPKNPPPLHGNRKQRRKAEKARKGR